MAKILIVDDEEEFTDMLALRLEKAGGHEVIKAYDGEEGLKLASENIPDLIILDILMPKLDGYDVMTRLKKNGKTRDIPVIILTASGTPSTLEKFKKLDPSDYIVKPFEPPDLMGKINKALGK